MTSTTSSSAGVVSPSLVFTLKGEAKQLRAAARAQGQELTQGAALELVAHRHGFRDWNALSAHAAQGGNINGPALFPWQDVAQPLPTLPMRIIEAHQRPTHLSVTELLRWARQLELIAANVAEENRSEMVDLIGARRPYVLERNLKRWPDGLFHLCDRGYEPFKGVALSDAQLHALGLPAWNEAYGQHGGEDAFTILGDDLRYARSAVMLKQMARLLASIALEADKTEQAKELQSA
jgi:hypothetical protein